MKGCAYSRSSKSAERTRGDLKRETKLLHSRLDGPGETKPLAVVDPEEILTFDQVCSSSLDVNHGHSMKCHCSAGHAISGVAATGYIIEASRSNYLGRWYNHKTCWPYL